MKKYLLIITLSLFISQAANAYPAPDLTTGGMPFQLIQQKKLKKMEIDNFRRFNDAYDNPVEDRMEDPAQIQAEFQKINNMKQPPKIELGQTKQKSDMELKENDGHIHIKHIEY